MSTASLAERNADSTADRFVAVAGAVFLLVLPFTSSIALRLAALAVTATAVAWSDLQRGHAAAGIRPPRRLVFPLLAWATIAFASLAWSSDPRYSLGELKSEVVYPLLAFFSFYIGARNALRWRLWNAALMASLIILGTLALAAQVFLGGWNPDRLHAGVGAYSTYLVLVFPFVLILLIPDPEISLWWGAWRKPLFALALAFILISGALTTNRILWPALAATLAVFSAGVWFGARDAHPRRKRLGIILGVVFAGLLIAFVAVVSYKARSAYPQAGGVEASLAQDDRLRVWHYAYQRILEAPWLGHGFGRGILRRDMQGSLGNDLLWHGHNLGMNYLLQLGVAGLAVLLWLLAALLREHWRNLRSREPVAQVLGITGLSLTSGFLVKCLTDDFLVRHTGLLFWSLSALLIGYAHYRRDA